MLKTNGSKDDSYHLDMCGCKDLRSKISSLLCLTMEGMDNANVCTMVCHDTELPNKVERAERKRGHTYWYAQHAIER